MGTARGATHVRLGRDRLGLAALPYLIGALLGLGVLQPPSADASRGLVTGFGDSILTSPQGAPWFARARQADAGLVRLGVLWSQVAPTRPANASDPSDPAYSFGVLDAAVSAAVANGLAPVLTISRAPSWAESGDGPGSAGGAWKPDPSALAQFAAALGKRYSGSFAGLPKVTFFEVWNEPNLDGFLAPQWKRGRPVAAIRYRSLLNSFYGGLKSVRPDATVIGGATAPFGDRPGGHRTRPVTFWRVVLCLTQRGSRLHRGKCGKGGPARMDILSHHPIKAIGSPAKPAVNPLDASSADLGRIRRLLRAAERFGTVKPGGHRPIWATELWWETNPFDNQVGVAPILQAYRLEQSLYLVWKAGGSAAINLQVVDSPSHVPDQLDQNGVFLANGSPKPSLTAFRFPFVGDRIGRRAVRAWGKSPAAGTVEIQRAANGGWLTLRSMSVGAGGVFVARLHVRRGTQLRASVAGQTSLVWTQR